MSLLAILRPVISLIPSIKQPSRKVQYKDKVYWTVVVLLIYLVYSQIPLFGIHLGGVDPLKWIRVIMASNRGTLMELGISPLMTSGLLMQLLTAAGLFALDMSNPADKELSEGVQKLLALVITFAQATGYIYSGMYGTTTELGYLKIFLIIGQLMVSGVILMLLDDLLQNGWGMGSGSNLFIATNYCETIFWKCFSPATFGVGRTKKFEGAVISAFHLLAVKKNKVRAIKEALFRPDLPNLSNMFATLLVFLVIVFLQGFKIEIPIQHVKYRGHRATYPIKLFYTSSMPVILQNAIVSNIFFISQLLYKHFPGNLITKFLGKWTDEGRYSMPVAGLAYYITPPAHFFADPLKTLVYIAFTMISCGFFSRLWVEMSGSSPKEVANMLKDQQLTVRGYRTESFIKVLYRYIPVAAWCGGVVIGIITIFSDCIGAVGSGTGILLAVSTIFQYYENYIREAQQDGMSFMGI
eukprot:GAHX01000386.1.p1 GENE.GAHX01000386.1~~GAHX01000386.1.p1  ORF type:complete len:467 (+),score=49.72 GAHX01000386.1:46-1446(+)